MTNNQPNIVVIGGGTGSYVVLKAVKLVSPNISAIVSMVDSGGSTGALRDQYGALPSGDIRQCILALSNSNKAMRDLLNYRFGEGDLQGHSFGNLLLAALEKTSDNFDTAVMKAGKILNITGTVIPATLDDTNLVLKDGDKEVVGEHNIESSVFKSGKKPVFSLRPAAPINMRAKQALKEADLIIFAPGSLYESVISVLLIDGVADAIDESKAKLLHVVNLVTKPGQTDNWMVQDYSHELERYLINKKLDFVLYNSAKPTKEMLKQYAHDGEFPVLFGTENYGLNAKYIAKKLISIYDEDIDTNDALAIERSLIRHDDRELAKSIKEIIDSIGVNKDA